MPTLVPIIPLADGHAARADQRAGGSLRVYAVNPRDLVTHYSHLGVEWVHFHDCDGLHAGRLVNSCAVTAIAVHKEVVVSVEGGVRTWQDARLYLSQSVDAVALTERDGWTGPFRGIGQGEVEGRILYEVPLSPAHIEDPDAAVALVRPLLASKVIPMLSGEMPFADLIRLANYIGVHLLLRRQLEVRAGRIEDLPTFRAGLNLAGGFIQAIFIDHEVLEPLGTGAALAMAREG